jgi:hypothetical protein
MFKHIKTSLIATLISLVFELIIYLFDFEVSLKLSILSFFFHSLNLILTILLVINYQNYSISRLDNFKKGILISVIFSFFISFYFFSYHKWINPVVLENKKNTLLELSEMPETLIQAKEKIRLNPDFYNGKSPADLIEMQQDNINELLTPSKVFPISLFSFLFTGTIFTLIISILTYFFRKNIK